jgi:hypothetical protein
MNEFPTIQAVFDAVNSGVTVYVGDENRVLIRDLLGDYVVSFKPWNGKVAASVPFAVAAYAPCEFFTKSLDK